MCIKTILKETEIKSETSDNLLIFISLIQSCKIVKISLLILLL